MLNVIFGCIIANIILFFIIFAVGLYFYKKYETEINKISEDVKEKINSISEAIDNVKSIDLSQITKTFESVDETMNKVNNEIDGLKSTIQEIKDKLGNIKLPW